jgi:hypothetical protein
MLRAVPWLTFERGLTMKPNRVNGKQDRSRAEPVPEESSPQPAPSDEPTRAFPKAGSENTADPI